MTLAELVATLSPAINPAYEGPQVADDMILAIGFPASGSTTAPTHPDDYLVAQQFISEHSGSITSTTQTTQYVRTGEVTTRTSANRVITVTGDRYIGDAFQDACLDFTRVFGVGGDVVAPYVYFSRRSGKGEKGQLSFDITADHEGAAGENDGFSITLTSTQVPLAYEYEPEPAPDPDPPEGT